MSDAPIPGSSGPVPRARSVSARTLWLAAAAVVLAASTALAWLQELRPDPFATPAINDPAWWLSPIERNAFRRLPTVAADLNGIAVAPGTEAMWVVGDGGLIAFSPDGGRTWQRQPIAPGSTPPARPAASVPGSRRSPGGFVAVAEAQSVQQQSPKQSKEESSVIVPDILGRGVGEAEEILKKNQLGMSVVSRLINVDDRYVINKQDPRPGERVPPGTTIMVGVTPRAQGRTDPAGPSLTPAQVKKALEPAPGATKLAPPPTPPPPKAAVAVTPLERRDLYAIHFVDPRRGWVVGETGTLLATSDSGEHWEPQSSGTLVALRAVHFLADGRRGWAAGDTGTILVTADGGQRWQLQATGAPEHLRSITFAADGRRGWSVGDAGTILTTSTGGEQWARVPRPTTYRLMFVHAGADGERGWVVGDRGTILTTEDGGKGWQRQDSRTEEDLRAIRFAADGRRGWAVGANGASLATVDGGRQWAPVTIGTTVSLRALAAASDGRRGWVVGSYGTVLATADGGSRWIARTAGTRSALPGLHLDRDSRRGWAAGGGGTILVTSDGGRTWQVQPSRTTRDLASIAFLADGRRGWASGDEGVLLSTVDGGSRWEQRRLEPAGIIINVRFLADGRRGWAATASGMFTTIDGGAQWNRHDTLRARLNGVHIADDGQRGWAVGSAGAIATTADGGIRWSSQKSDTTAELLSVHFDSQGRRGWAVGDRGTIRVTTDGGATWRRQASGTTAPLYSVTFLADGLQGWATSLDGALLATTNGGERWQSRTIEPKAPLFSVRFADDGRRGWITGWGAIWTTTDGGQAWAQVAHATFPAPWYYLACLLTLGLLIPALRRPAAQAAPQRSVADVLVSDKPLELGEPDPLGFGQVARGLSRFLRNEQTKPPLTIAITGPWGSGKSSLMNLLRGDLRQRGFRPVWFNAWHHQKEEHLLAALLQNILAQAVPGWLSREGVVFRARLLGHRFGRRWHLALPLFALAAALVGFFFADHPARVDALVERAGTVVERMVGVVNPLFPTGVKDALEQAKQALRDAGVGSGTASQAIPTAVATLVLLFMVWRGITAFGVNPADLMATVSGRFKRRALEAKVGFRHEFAREFRDVTGALHPRTMLILIDDLDRCRPENVLEVLEAVNFLVSSGDCFVVMGMELDRVRRCVGLGFKDVAEELTDREERAETTAETTTLATERDEGKRRRAVFAQQYLEKLINIEVPVPLPTEGQAARVIAPEAPADDGLGRWPTIWTQVRGAGRLLVPVAALAVAVVGGFWSGLVTWPPPAPAPAPVVDARGTAIPSTGAATVGSQPEAPEPPPEQGLKIPAFVIGGESALPSRWLTAWPLTALVLAALVVFLQRPPIVVKDSDEFTEAIKAWHPLLFSRRTTPRSAKRFLNRVRYYAMRQRDVPEERRVDRVTAWMADRLRRGPAPPSAGDSIDVIPERILVGLSAIEYAHADWLADARLFKDPEGFLADQPLPPALKPAVSSLGLGRDLLRYRPLFDRLSAGVRT